MVAVSRSVDFPACSVDAPYQRNRQYWSAINVVDAESFGWGEGWPEHEFRRGRPAIAGADASGERPWDGKSERLHGGDRNVADSLRSERRATGQGEFDREARGRQQSADRSAEPYPALRNGTYWADADWIVCHDGKARRAQSGIRFLVDGLPGRVDLWRVGGNAIVPPAAAEVIAAFIDAYGIPKRVRLRSAASSAAIRSLSADEAQP
jgi:DNA (cytosine-5)-methyltransferase 1